MLVVDTGALCSAVADSDDADHEACDRLLADEPGELVVGSC